MKIVLALSLLFILGTTYYILTEPPQPPQLKESDPNAARILLENLAAAQKIYSVQNGGGGNSKFADDLAKLSGFYAEKIKPVLIGEQTSFYGYLVRMEENPRGDNFTTNFRFIAYPAPGYKGASFSIDKKEIIETIQK